MKVVHVCTFSGGGAAIAARRQSKALRQAGFASYFLSMKEVESEEISCETLGDNLLFHVPKNLWSYHGSVVSKYCVGNRTGISNTWFSLWPTELPFDAELFTTLEKFDVVHLHWVVGLVSSRLLEWLRNAGKGVVITGHDMNYFTGGCHYNAGCRRFESGCLSCAQLESDPLALVPSGLKEKRRVLDYLDPVWVFPSEWLLDEFKRSGIPSCNAKIVRNCVDDTKFFPVVVQKKNALREKFGFAVNEQLIVAGAQDNVEIRKGLSILRQSLFDLMVTHPQDQPLVKVVTFGSGHPDFPVGNGVTHQHLGPLEEDEVAELLQCSDLIAMPSLEDNFPNLVLEGLHCACPVLAFGIGGIPDIVESGVNGLLVEEVSACAFSRALRWLVREDRLDGLQGSTRNWFDVSASEYSLKQVASELAKVYKGFSLDSSQPSVQWKDNTFYRKLWGLPKEFGFGIAYRFAEDMKSHVEAHRRREHVSESNRTMWCSQVPILWLSPPEREQSREGQSFYWARLSTELHFSANADLIQRLIIKVPNIDLATSVLKRALPSISITLNGDSVSFSVERHADECSYWYISAIVSCSSGSVARELNCLLIRLHTPTVSLEDDERGLGFIFSSLFVVEAEPSAANLPCPMLEFGMWPKSEWGQEDVLKALHVAPDMVRWLARPEGVEALGAKL